jgi:hypothetical protein
MDAIPSPSIIWFQFDPPLEVDDCRLSLLAFILCMDVLGNSFCVEGAMLPSHLAAVLQQSFSAHELFLAGVSNVPERIVGESRFGVLSYIPQESSLDSAVHRRKNADAIFARRTIHGFDIVDSSDSPLLRISTNLTLYASVNARDPLSIIETSLYLLIYDALGPRALSLTVKETDHGRLLERYLKEVGGEVV